MTGERADAPATSGDRPTLPRFTRDVRLLGGRGDAPYVGPWTGIRRPFGGVLEPGIALGEWPPPVLAHLTLGDLLADALVPAGGRGSKPDAPVATEDPERSMEPTVREVLREVSTGPDRSTGAPTAGVDSVDRLGLQLRDAAVGRALGEGGDGRAGPDESPTDSGSAAPAGAEAGSEWSERAGERDRGVDRPGDPAAGNGPAADPAPTGDGSSSPAVGSIREPRTVVREFGRPSPHPTSASSRDVTRLVDPGRAAETADDGATPTASGRSSWPAPPVERAMPSVPETVGREPGLAADVGGSTSSPAGPDIAADAGDRPLAGDAPSRPGNQSPDRPGGDDVADAPPAAPAMTVRRGATAPVSEDGGSNADGSTASTGPGADDGRSSVVAREIPESAPTSAPGSPPTGAGARVDVEEAEVVQRAVAGAVTDPRVVDRLYRELERRRRIERERGGRR